MLNQLYIGGEWRDAADDGTVEVENPATGEIITRVASATVEDGLAAVESAYAAGQSWSRVPPRERAEVLRKAYALMTDRADEIARLMVMENGKCLADAEAETAYAAEFFRWYSEEAVRNLGEVSIAPSGKNRILVELQPVGVSVLVTPWNFPAAMATRKIGPALAAGCTVILKPATLTPLTALLVAQILEDAGVPAGVVNVLPSRQSGKLVSAMLHDPRVRKLSFTGSTEVGRILLKEAADSIVNCSMELGGNAPFLVLEDADIDAAVAGAMVAKMRNGGEACTAANRFLVQENVAEEFTEKFAAAMGKLKIGNGLEKDVRVGPLVDASTRDKVAELVEDAVGKGARVDTGGRALEGKGYFYAPTVLSGIPDSATLLREEIFGPVAPITTFADLDEAIARANDTEYGLIAYVYTGDLARGLYAAERIEAGMVALNRGIASDPAAPFGGVKQSGIGREGSYDGMLEFLEKKYIAVDW